MSWKLKNVVLFLKWKVVFKEWHQILFVSSLALRQRPADLAVVCATVLGPLLDIRRIYNNNKIKNEIATNDA